MRLQDLALASARAAIASEKASGELSDTLGKWIVKHLVKGITLPTLRAMHSAGVLNSFLECLGTRNQADVIGVLRKVDPHRVDILKLSRSEMEAHIRDVAGGRIEPAPDLSKITLPRLKSLDGAGNLDSFLTGLGTHSAADVITLLRKLDPHRADILACPRQEMEDHIRGLATGQIVPAKRPQTPRASSKARSTPNGSVSKPVGVAERARAFWACSALTA
jgi:hypothetical protein